MSLQKLNQLAAESEKHREFVGLVESGIIKCSAKKLKKHKEYLTQLHKQMMDIAPVDETTAKLTNEELLKELGVKL